jgi:hypothetical protein
MIALQPAIHDGGVTLLRDTFLGHLGVDPFRVTPHLGADLAELDGRRGIVAHNILECLVEVAVVKEDVGIVVPPVEVALDGFDGLNYAV